MIFHFYPEKNAERQSKNFSNCAGFFQYIKPSTSYRTPKSTLREPLNPTKSAPKQKKPVPKAFTLIDETLKLFKKHSTVLRTIYRTFFCSMRRTLFMRPAIRGLNETQPKGPRVPRTLGPRIPIEPPQGSWGPLHLGKGSKWFICASGALLLALVSMLWLLIEAERYLALANVGYLKSAIVFRPGYCWGTEDQNQQSNDHIL